MRKIVPIEPKQGLRKNAHSLSEKIRSQSVVVLLPLLATHTDLYLQLKQAHWNVKGPDFIALHELLDQVATLVNGFTDELAERIVQLGGSAPAGIKGSELKPVPVTSSAEGNLKAATSALSVATKELYDAISQTSNFGDDVTADICTRIAGELDKQLWFIESHLSK